MGIKRSLLDARPGRDLDRSLQDLNCTDTTSTAPCPNHRYSHRFWLLCCYGILLSIVASGCVRRRMLVCSNPPGALVYVDNVEVGTTPCAVNYTYYGTREIRLVKDGYETLTVNQPFPTPWYEIPPLDLVSETMVPYEIRDERQVTYNLLPQMMVPGEQLLSRAEQLRRSTHGGRNIPLFAPDPASGTQPGAETLPYGGESLPAPASAPFSPP